jgi:N-acetyl-beta-hexosaminidase
MQKIPIILPYPRYLKFIEGVYELSEKNFISLQAKHAQTILLSAQRLKATIFTCIRNEFHIFASGSGYQDRVGFSLEIDPELNVVAQGYRIVITSERITVQGKDEAGLYYGCCTLGQLFQYYSSDI